MADLAQPVFLDATVLSNFASSEAVEWLAELLERPAVVLAVAGEIERGRDHGHRFLADAIDRLDAEISLVATSGGEKTSGASGIRESLDAGEAESLLLAIERDGALATDDLAARRLASEHGVPVTGSVGLLVLGIERDTVTVTTADEWLNTWEEKRGYYAPVDSVTEALPDENG